MPAQSITDKTAEKKRQFIELYSRSTGVIAEICRKVRISRETYYRWKREDSAFADALFNARATVDDEVEDLLMRKIFIENDGASIRYYLDRKHPAYNPKNREWNAAMARLDTSLYDADTGLGGENTFV